MATHSTGRNRLAFSSQELGFSVPRRDRERTQKLPDDASKHFELFQRSCCFSRNHQSSTFLYYRDQRRIDSDDVQLLADHLEHLCDSDPSSRSKFRIASQSPRSVTRFLVPRSTASSRLQPSIVEGSGASCEQTMHPMVSLKKCELISVVSVHRFSLFTFSSTLRSSCSIDPCEIGFQIIQIVVV